MAKTTICKCKVLFNLNLARIASGLKINKCTQFNSHKDIIITSIKIRTTNTSIIHTYNKEIIQIWHRVIYNQPNWDMIMDKGPYILLLMKNMLTNVEVY
jgi:hypothetical protein